MSEVSEQVSMEELRRGVHSPAALFDDEPQQGVCRVYDSLTGLVEGLQAAKALHLTDVTVTTTIAAPHTTDKTHLPKSYRYHLDAREAVAT